jgi:glycosyltransferase involved in cell wall biosynthesis
MAAAFLFSFISHKPYIVSCQGSDIRIASRNLLRRIFQIPFLYNAEKIVAVSNEISEILKRKYGIPKSRTLVVGTGYDDRIRQELGEIKLRAETQRSMRIINVANMRAVKDHRTLLEGFKKLTERMNGVRLSLVGDGPLRRQLEEFCTQQSIHGVEFLGQLPHRDALKHIANSDVFILTSVEEGMPSVIIEALALGKPVIATAVGGIPEVVKDGVNGILVPPKSAEHIAKALERLLSDSGLRRKLGRAAAESVKDYTWSKIAEKYERIYSISLKGD